jgi:hypothetical protein
MSYSLHETLNQIDPYVKLNDGVTIRTVQQVLFSAGPYDGTEYVMFSDPVGRLLIYEVGEFGSIVRPPVFIEEKRAPIRSKSRQTQTCMA